MRSFTLLAAFVAVVSSEDLKGSCVDGTDPMGVEQTCYGRCHIYESGPGWYGACDSYKVQPVDVSGPCGDSPQTACLSTFNAGWDAQKTNCGNCYYVEMRYEDGTVTSTYLKTMDTNGSETKFEMSGPAWVNLCPFVCAGSGDCAHAESACPYGIIAQTDSYPGPISCTNQRTQITFKRVDCDGSAPPQPPAPQPTVRTTPAPPAYPTTRAPVPTTRVPPAVPTTRAPVPNVPTTRPSPPVRPTQPAPPTTAADSDAIGVCKASLGHPTDQAWSDECKNLCQYYGDSDAFCPARHSGEGLISCVMTAATYCQRTDGDATAAEDNAASSIDGCSKSIGHATNPAWASGCKDLCAYYGSNSAFCPTANSAESLLNCVMTAAPYCERITDGDSSAEDNRAAVIEGCTSSLGHASNPAWASGCKDLCAYYGGNAAFCPSNDSVESLIACVMTAAPYCERL